MPLVDIPESDSLALGSFVTGSIPEDYREVRLTARDQNNGTGISDTAYFVNGARLDSNVYGAEPNANYVVEARANSYDPLQRTVQVPDGYGPIQEDLFLANAAVSTSQFQIQTNPPVSAVPITLDGPAQATELTSHEGVATFSNLPDGDYNVHLTAGGYVPRQPEPLSLTSGKPAELSLVKIDSDPATSVQGPTIVAPGTVVNEQAGIPFEYNPAIARAANQAFSDTVTPNLDYYYTASQCLLYINDLFIDELVTFQFVVNNNVIPVYSYASKFATAFGSGKSLVQGQIVINYVMPDYMSNALTKPYIYKPESPTLQRNSKTQEERTQMDVASKKVLSIFKQYDYLASLPQTDDVVAAREAALKEADATISQLPPDVANEIMAAYAAQQEVSQEILYNSAVFQMKLFIGANKDNLYRTFNDCRLVSKEAIFDQQSGQIILESYGFLCRSVS